MRAWPRNRLFGFSPQPATISATQQTLNTLMGMARYTGTATLSTTSRIICSACSDFFKVEE